MRRSLRRDRGKSSGDKLNSAVIEIMEQRILLSAIFTVTNTNPSGAGSLADAINESNATATSTPNTIDFNIPGSGTQVIVQSAQPLPTITQSVDIDGTSQPGYVAGSAPLIVVETEIPNGSGLVFTPGAINSTVKGLTIDTTFGGGGSEIVIDGAYNVTVSGNYIGTDPTGTETSLPDSDMNGILIEDGATADVIGGTTAGTGNVIAGANGGAGVDIQGTLFAPQTSDNIVEGNFIGTDATGKIALGNTTGVLIDGGATGNIIGGTPAGAGNIISGNFADGVEISGTITGPQTSGNSVEGNYIGTDVTGKNAVFNNNGVQIDDGSTGNIIGGTTAAARNIISGSSGFGVEISGTVAGPQTSDNSVEGNYIGTDVTGENGLANGFGVEIGGGSTDNIIGGTTAGARNVISANVGGGVVIDGNELISLDNETGGNIVEGNYIGTDATGNMRLGNFFGVEIDEGASGNVIGGSTAGAGNVIAANTLGVQIVPIALVSTSQNLIEGNYIGTDSTGTATNLGNQVGVEISGGAAENSVGGPVAADGNVIAYNIGDGVDVGLALTDHISVLNDIRLNSIYGNGGLGIDLGNSGVTLLNSPSVVNSGPNDLQNYPILASAVSNGSTTTVQGFFNSAPSTGFILDFYSNPTLDADGFVQGKTYIGSFAVSTDGSGNATFSATLGVSVTPGEYITATATTATDLPFYGDTSEFAAPVQDIGPQIAPTIQLSAPNVVYDGLAQGATAVVLGTGNAVVGTATLTYYAGKFASGTALSGAPVNAGTYTVLASFAGGNGYIATTAIATYTIEQAHLTITANNQSRTYGAVNPPLTLTYKGFVDSQTPAVLTTQPKVTTSATQWSNVGNYSINVSGAVDPNYSITYVGGTLTINKAVLTVTVKNTSKQHGHANPAFTVTYGGFVLGQGPNVLGGSLNFTTTAKKNSPKGKYAVNVSGLYSPNYSFDYVPGTLQIT